MSRKYNNPPVVEVLCEFQFIPIPDQPWDMTIPGLLYEKVKDTFTKKKQVVNYAGNIRPNNIGGIEQEIQMLPPRMQYIRPDNSALIQVSSDLLTVNHLKPYPTWKEFKPIILTNLNLYKDIAKPKGFNRIGLRYINIVSINEKSESLRDYFNYYPHVPPTLSDCPETFNVVSEIPYNNSRDRLILTLATVVDHDKPDAFSLLLDIDYIILKPESIPLDNVSDWLENAHSVIEKAFEEIITDKCRKLFI